MELKPCAQAVAMPREITRQTFKLQLLAFVLALALVWYSLNPMSGHVTLRKPDDELPDERKRRAKPQVERTADWPAVFGTLGVERAAQPLEESADDFDWPEYIDG